jgi:NAD(P)-dependent dehydrogenase (short-subunit alcohol dehydrogenase family)
MMKEQNSDRIINISSFRGQAGPLTSGAYYCASKLGAIGLNETFRKADQGITGDTVAIANIATPEMESLLN